MAEKPKTGPEELGAELLRFLRERRSVRSYEPTPVPREYFELIAQAAATAPFWGPAPCWRLIAVTQPKTLQKVREAATRGLNRANFWIHTAPAILVCCAKPGLSKRRQGIGYYVADAAVALEHAALMAHQLGLGTCWVGAFSERPLRRACHIPSSHRVVALLTMGYPRKEEEGFLGLPVIEDFGQYYDLARAKIERGKRAGIRDVLSFETFPE